MRRILRAGMSSVLVLVLVLQTACATLGPPMPFSPEDPAQVEALERAAQVRVVTLDGATYRLVEPDVLYGKLRGRESGSLTAQYIVLPADSIETIRRYKANAVLTVFGVIAGLAAFVVVACIASPDCVQYGNQ